MTALKNGTDLVTREELHTPTASPTKRGRGRPRIAESRSGHALISGNVSPEKALSVKGLSPSQILRRQDGRPVFTHDAL